mmetsp:Transcript_35447/g.92736  ORF Transcript_35447/g.92736 Transcript_35447/m.92736 type:complete len:224 (-) Transcript_35447:295-966(-)
MCYLMKASVIVLTVHTPLPSTVNGTPLYVATHLMSVLRSGRICSRYFFFFMALAVAGALPSPDIPGKVMTSPGTAPAGGSTGSTVSALAHITIALDMMPPILAGLRFMSRTTGRFCMASRGTLPLRPDRTTIDSDPVSIFSMKSLSDSGCILASVTRPTRRSSKDTSISAGATTAPPPLAAFPALAFFGSPPLVFFSALAGAAALAGARGCAAAAAAAGGGAL